MLRSASSARQGIRARGRLARASPRAALAPAGAWIRRPRRKTIAASHSGPPKYRIGIFHGPSRMVPADVDTSGTAAPDGTIPYESTSCETGRASSSCYEELTLSVPSVATSISAVAKGCRSGCKARTVQPWPVWCHSPHAFSLAQHSWTQSSWLYCSWVRRVARCRQ